MARAQNVRCDGRSALDLRHLVVQSGVVDFCNGSALLERVGTGAAVVAGVKLEIVELGAASGARGGTLLYDVSVDVSTLEARDEDASQRRLRDLQKMLADQTEAQLAQMVGGARARLLEVVPGKVAWCVCVDLVVLGSDGNLEDLCSLAVYAALADARLPKTSLVEAEGGADFAVEPEMSSAVPLAAELLLALPLRVTLFQVGALMVADASEQEEHVAACALSVLVNRRGQLCSTHIDKAGRLPLTALAGHLGHASQIARELFKLLDMSSSSSSRKTSSESLQQQLEKK